MRLSLWSMTPLTHCRRLMLMLMLWRYCATTLHDRRSALVPGPRVPRSTGPGHNVCIIALQMTNVPLVPLDLRVWVRVMVGWKSVLFSTLDVSCRDPWTLGLVDPGTRGPRDSWTKTVQLINVELSACRGRRAPPTRPPNDVVHRIAYFIKIALASL